jgi:hypothetical protein
VADHPVLRAHCQALDVPAAHHRLPRLRLGEGAVLAQRLDVRDSWVVVAT